MTRDPEETGSDLGRGFRNREIRNGDVFVTVAMDFGPRILSYGFAGQPSVLGLAPDIRVETPYGPWRAHGGHRLSVAPERMPLSYEPDDAPVTLTARGPHGLELSQRAGQGGIAKQLSLTLAATGSELTLVHRLENCNAAPVEVAPWGVTILAADAVALVPQEPARAHSECFDAARSLTLWHYTDLGDPRFTFSRELVRIRADRTLPAPQKLGFANRAGWAAGATPHGVLVKRFGYRAGASYPDFGSNCEVFTAAEFLELETLGPLVTLSPGAATELIERWTLCPPLPIAQDAALLAALSAGTRT